MNKHKSARLTPRGRERIVRQVEKRANAGGRRRRREARRGWHQADVLWNKLLFLPSYAQQSQLLYRYIRVDARLRGWSSAVAVALFRPPRCKFQQYSRTIAYVDAINCQISWRGASRITVWTPRAAPPL